MSVDHLPQKETQNHPFPRVLPASEFCDILQHFLFSRVLRSFLNHDRLETHEPLAVSSLFVTHT